MPTLLVDDTFYSVMRQLVVQHFIRMGLPAGSPTFHPTMHRPLLDHPHGMGKVLLLDPILWLGTRRSLFRVLGHICWRVWAELGAPATLQVLGVSFVGYYWV